MKEKFLKRASSILIIDERMRNIEKEKLKELGYDLVEIKKNPNVYEEISSHVDIFVCKVEEKIIVEPTVYEYLSKEINVEKGETYIYSEYPKDIAYNLCTIGKKAIHKLDSTDSKIRKELIKNGYELINTKQGYTNCSIAVIDENSAIVTDKGVYNLLKSHKIDALFLDYQPDIKLLKENCYSNKQGFIGGAISRIDENIIIFGDLNKIDIDNKIRNFILKRNLKIIEFKNLDVIDYGGVVNGEVSMSMGVNVNGDVVF